MRMFDRMAIYALSFAIVALVIALLMQKSRKAGDTGEIAPNRDLFNMKGKSERDSEFEKIDRLERIK